MKTSVPVILLAEDDDGHACLIERNLRRSSLMNPIERFKDGQQLLDFLFRRDPKRLREAGVAYLLLLDIRMPKVDGMQVLETIKREPLFRSLPVIMLTTTDDPREVLRCHELGCNNYTMKPVDYQQFTETIRALGAFIAKSEVPILEEN